MPSYEPAPYRRWNPQPSWLQVAFHPPARGQIYEVKHYSDGVPFRAYLNHSGVWMLNDADSPDHGQMLPSVIYLYWLSKV